MTGTSGPGIALKSEAIGLAVMVELPLVVIDVQRAGPSTGMPTKNEQADLLQVLFGRNSDSPVAVVAPSTPSDCFDMAFEAVRIALKYMTPVVYLSDAFLATGAEPWLIPSAADLPDISVPNRTEKDGFHPYDRDPVTLARPWAVPGTPGLEHRIGGLEKADITGNVSYDPDNHHRMQLLRRGQDRRHRRRHPRADRVRSRARRPAHPRLGLDLRLDPERRRAAPGRWPERRPRPSPPSQPVPPQPRRGPRQATATCSSRRSTSASCRSSSGRRYLVDAIAYDRVRGKPFRIAEIVAAAEAALKGEAIP